MSRPPADLVERTNAALALAVAEEGRHAEGGVVQEEDGLLLTGGTGALPLPPNGAMRTADGPDDARTLARAVEFHRERGSGFGFQMRLGPSDDGLLALAQEARPLLVVDAPAMVRTTPLEPPDPACDLRPVTDPDDTAAYAGVMDEAYRSLGWPEGGPAALFANPALLLQPDRVAFLIYEGDRAVAGAYVLLTHGLGLVSWVGTREEARGRGRAEAVTRAVTNAAFERGAEAACLVASPMGEPLYRRLGYETFARDHLVILWPGLPQGPERR